MRSTLVLATLAAGLMAAGCRESWEAGFIYHPTRTVEESDIGFLRTLWTRITSGATPEDCERAIAADSYRIRSLLAHWLETGALAFQPRVSGS